jgi:hypothetical protein
MVVVVVVVTMVVVVVMMVVALSVVPAHGDDCTAKIARQHHQHAYTIQE